MNYLVQKFPGSKNFDSDLRISEKQGPLKLEILKSVNGNDNGKKYSFSIVRNSIQISIADNMQFEYEKNKTDI